MKLLLFPLMIITAISLNAAGLYELTFESDSNGTGINTAINSGDLNASWDFGGGARQKRGGNNAHHNIGYTHYYKGTFNGGLEASTNADPETVFRRLSLDNGATTGGDFTFTAVFDGWQLNPGSMDPDTGRGLLLLLSQQTMRAHKLVLKMDKVLALSASLQCRSRSSYW